MNGPDRFPQSETRGMPGTDLYLISDRIGYRAKKDTCIYLSTVDWNQLLQVWVDSQALQVSSF